MKRDKTMTAAVTIASTDSSGGAGIIADLRALGSIGVHGAGVATTVTAQNTKQVKTIFPLPPSIVKQQLESVFSDLSPKAAKTGMLYSPEIAREVTIFMNCTRIPLVVDPVLRATTGKKLYSSGYLKELRRLIGIATIVTPNIQETEALTCIKIRSINDIKVAAEAFLDTGCEYVLIKGGHLKGDNSTDFLYDGRKLLEYSSRRIQAKLHGTGCAYSALIAGYLALGKTVPDAVKSAKIGIAAGIANRYLIGKGQLGVPGFI